MRLFSLTAAALASAAGLTFAQQAEAFRVAVINLNPTQKTVNSEAVIVGKVAEIEKELTQAAPHPGAPNKVGMQVANVKITEALTGAKGLTVVRVAFMPNPNAPVASDAPVRPIRRPFPGNVSLTEGQEGVFFLRKHHDGDFYVLTPSSPPLDKKAEAFEKDLAQVKKVLKVITDPMAALKSEETADRTFAAGVLITKYRNPQGDGRPLKQEPVPAEESQLILKGLSEMEWKVEAGGFHMQQLWYSLQVQPKDGWTQPKLTGQPTDAKLMEDSIKKWLAEKGKDYRIQRFVPVQK